MTENKNVEMFNELLDEKNLFDVYLTSRKIPFSNTNIFLLTIFSIISLSLSLGITSSELAEMIPTISASLISVILTVLGFLIAGYAIFCSVMNHTLSIEIYNSNTKPFGFSQLKYSHLLFMRVFFYYLLYTIFLTFIIFFSKSKILEPLITSKIENINCFYHLINYLVFNILFIGISFLLLQLASFTFNIYHSVMTSICLNEINK